MPTLQNSLIYDSCIVVKSSGKTQVKYNLQKITNQSIGRIKSVFFFKNYL